MHSANQLGVSILQNLGKLKNVAVASAARSVHQLTSQLNSAIPVRSAAIDIFELTEEESPIGCDFNGTRSASPHPRRPRYGKSAESIERLPNWPSAFQRSLREERVHAALRGRG